MKYNLLTLQLLYEGYTSDNHPDFVKVCTSQLTGNNPLKNLSGGFVYTKSYLSELVFKTPCGKHVLGSHVFDNFSYLEEWLPENNNPVILCPFTIGDFSCDLIHPLLKNPIGHDCLRKRMQFCSCCMTNEAYDYENSVERARKERDRYIEKRFQEFSEKKNGHVCRNHCQYNEVEDKWEMHYSPETCVYRCYSEYCPIRGRELNKKKANVYYDILTKGVRDCGFYEEEWEKVEKGVRFFDKPVSRDICEAFVKLEADTISRRYRMNHGSNFLMDGTFSYEIKNIRVEARPHRDLEEDLRDISEGRFISWAPADEKMKKEEKRQRRQAAKEKRIKKLEKKIIELGMDNLEDVDKIRADKLFSQEQQEEMMRLHDEKLKEPVFEQVSLF